MAILIKLIEKWKGNRVNPYNFSSFKNKFNSDNKIKSKSDWKSCNNLINEDMNITGHPAINRMM